MTQCPGHKYQLRNIHVNVISVAIALFPEEWTFAKHKYYIRKKQNTYSEILPENR